MSKKEKVIIGLVILLVVGVIAGVGLGMGWKLGKEKGQEKEEVEKNSITKQEAINIANNYIKVQGYKNWKVKQTFLIDAYEDYKLEGRTPSWPWDPPDPKISPTLRNNVHMKVSPEIIMWGVKYYISKPKIGIFWVFLDANSGKIIGTFDNWEIGEKIKHRKEENEK